MVTSVFPDSAHFGDTVTISGYHLAPNINGGDQLMVKFNGCSVHADSILYNDATTLKVLVPKGCVTGYVTVDLNISDGLLNKGTGAYFKYLPTWHVSIIAGGGTNHANCPLSDVGFYTPRYLACDGADKIYVIDEDLNSIRKLDMQSGLASVVINSFGLKQFDADQNAYIFSGSGSQIQFVNNQLVSPYVSLTASSTVDDIISDKNDNLYVSWSDYSQQISGILKIDAARNVTSVYQTTYADTDRVYNIAFYNNNLYGFNANRYFKIDVNTGLETTIKYSADYLDFYYSEISFDRSGNLYVANGNNIKLVKPNGSIIHFAGSVNGTGGTWVNTSNLSDLVFSGIGGIVVDSKNKVYVSNMGTARSVVQIYGD